MDSQKENLYEAPQTDLNTPTESPAQYTYVGPQAKSISDSMGWISSGYAIFKQSPGAWVATMVVGFILAIVISLIPIVGTIFSMLTTYVWIGGIMLGCQAVSEGEKFDIKYLFEGFKNRAGSLIGLSVVATLISIVVMLGAMGSTYIDLLSGQAPENFDMTTMVLPMLVGMALLIPLFMAVWFAPVLIVLQGMNILNAMKSSFAASVKNVLPLFVYGIVLMVLYILGAIPLLLGLLVVIPVVFASIFSAYQDIFLTKNNT